MNKGEFISLLKKPQDIDAKHISDLQEVVQRYPYCSSSQLLLTKAFHYTDNINFEASLRKTAAYAADRSQLHALLFHSSTTEKPSPELKTIEQKDNSILKTELTEERPTAETTTTTSAPIEKPPIREKAVEELAPKQEDELDAQILSSAIHSSILLEVSDEIPEIDSLPAMHQPKEAVLTETVSDAKQSEDVSERSFSDWIRHFSDDLEEKTVEEESPKPVFIEPNNEKVEFYSASKMAKLSVQEDDDLVTETLANIYADQGSFEKAIKAFQRLQLKYPEKRVYFAGRIKEIQNQINS